MHPDGETPQATSTASVVLSSAVSLFVSFFLYCAHPLSSQDLWCLNHSPLSFNTRFPSPEMNPRARAPAGIWLLRLPLLAHTDHSTRSLNLPSWVGLRTWSGNLKLSLLRNDLLGLFRLGVREWTRGFHYRSCLVCVPLFAQSRGARRAGSSISLYDFLPFNLS